MKAMYKIAVIGARDTVMGFKALGLEAIPVDSTESARSEFKRLTRAGESYAIIYIEEAFAKELSSEIERFKDMPTPAVILIPGKEGSLGMGLSALTAAVERAVGADIL